MALHEKQVEILKILADNEGNPLKLKDIQEMTGLSSPSHVHHHIQQLEKRGYLKRDPLNPRDYHVVTKRDAMEYLPLYGKASCGPDGTLVEENEVQRIPVYSKFVTFDPSYAFLMEASGDSMEPRIMNGDFVIGKRQNFADDGQVVICTWDEEVRVKVFRKVNDETFVLESYNKSYPPIVVTDGQLKIEGILKGIISTSIP